MSLPAARLHCRVNGRSRDCRLLAVERVHMTSDSNGTQPNPVPASGPIAASLVSIFGEVHTDRLALRRPREEDGPAMFRVHGDPETNRYNPAGPHRDLAQSEEILRTWLRQWADDGFGYWAVALPHSLEVVGFSGIRRQFLYDREVLNLYYRFMPSAWGLGYATEVAQAAVHLARAHLPMLPVIARTRPGNIPSIRTAERAGLSRRSDLDTNEHIIFALGWPPAEETDLSERLILRAPML